MRRSRYETYRSGEMEFWLIENGEKLGPFPDYEIRSRLRDGRLKSSEKIWYADLKEWTVVGDVDLFVDELEEEVEDLEEPVVEPPPLPRELFLWRRFGARWFDWVVYQAVLFALLTVSGVDIAVLTQSPWFFLLWILPWAFVESVLLSSWGTTPGKWLVGLTVRNEDGSKLTAWPAIRRSMRVMVLGMGFGMNLLTLVCHGISAWFLVKKKVVLWDTPTGVQLVRTRSSPERWSAFGIGLALALMMNAALQLPVVIEQGKKRMTPEERARWEKIFPE
ncbi:MAG: RDD family protein [Verrucomicrobiota bacterium]